MSVRDRLQSDRPVETLKRLNEVSRAFKAEQRLGSSSLVTHRVFSEDSWDLDVTSSSSVRMYEVEFIPDDMTLGGAYCYDAWGVTYYGSYRMERVWITDRRQRWRFVVAAGAAQKVKFYFFTTGSGTFTGRWV